MIPPDLEFATHYHDTDYCTLVLKGSLRVGRTWYRAGHFRVQDAKSVYGPALRGRVMHTLAEHTPARREWALQAVGRRWGIRADDFYFRKNSSREPSWDFYVDF